MKLAAEGGNPKTVTQRERGSRGSLGVMISSLAGVQPKLRWGVLGIGVLAPPGGGCPINDKKMLLQLLVFKNFLSF